MGRLNIKKYTKSFFLPLTFAILLFLVIRPAFAQIVSGDTGFADYLKTEDVETGTETVEGYSQIYYKRGFQKVFVTKGGNNNFQPSSRGEYLTWVSPLNGAGQIYLHNLLTGQSIQLTSYGTNQLPKVSREGKAVWMGWDDAADTWQIWLFDGKSVKQISENGNTANPEIEGDYVVYGQKENGTWSAKAYSMALGANVTLNTGIATKFPRIENGRAVYGKAENIVEPLSLPDLFLLNSNDDN